MSLFVVRGSRVVAQGAATTGGYESVSIPVPGTEPIGTGRPLSIIIRHVYTGKFPASSFLSSRKDVLVTSAVRDVFATFNAAPRAINLLKRRIASRADMFGIDATESGTPLVFYTPAVTSVSTTATFEMSFDDFPDELVTRVSNAITTAGNVPVFGPYGPVLIGVGLAIKLAASAVNALSDSKAEFSVSERLEFELPDGEPLAAGYRVLCANSFDPTPLSFKLGKGLVDGAGKPYDGDEPYIVVLLDGARRDAFADFTPTAATAAILERFLQQKDGSDVAINTIVDAVKLFNDLRYRKEADKLDAQLQGLDENSDQYRTLKKKVDALLANVSEPLLKAKP